MELPKVNKIYTSNAFNNEDLITIYISSIVFNVILLK